MLALRDGSGFTWRADQGGRDPMSQTDNPPDQDISPDQACARLTFQARAHHRHGDRAATRAA